MKWIVLASALTWMSNAFSAPIFCGDQENGWSVAVSANQKTAKVERDGMTVQYGDLDCSPSRSRNEGAPFLICHSRGIADDGYNFLLYGPSATNPVGRLNQESFGGEKLLAELNCVAAQNQ